MQQRRKLKKHVFSETIWTPLVNAIVYALCICTLTIAPVRSMWDVQNKSYTVHATKKEIGKTRFFRNHINVTRKHDTLSVVHMHSTDGISLEHGRLLEQKLHYTCNKEGNWRNTFFFETIWTPLVNAIVYALCICTLPIAPVRSMSDI